MAKIPENLRLLFLRLDLLAGVGDNQKISFKTNQYFDKDGWNGWYGTFSRTLGGERMEVTGIAEVTSICQVAVELYTMYGKDSSYGKTLLNKIVNARKGLNRLKLTYDSIGKTMAGSSINTSGILVLDSIIPDSRKLTEGFCTSEDNYTFNIIILIAIKNFIVFL